MLIHILGTGSVPLGAVPKQECRRSSWDVEKNHNESDVFGIVPRASPSPSTEAARRSSVQSQKSSGKRSSRVLVKESRLRAAVTRNALPYTPSPIPSLTTRIYDL